MQECRTDGEEGRALTFFDVLPLSFDVKKVWKYRLWLAPLMLYFTYITPHMHKFTSETVVKLEVAPPEPPVLPLFEPPLQLRREVRLPVAGLPLPHEGPVHPVLPLLLQLLVQVLKMKLTFTFGTRFAQLLARRGWRDCPLSVCLASASRERNEAVAS